MMLETEVYLPVRYNDGRVIPSNALNGAVEAISHEMGGCSLLPHRVDGAYIMAGTGVCMSEEMRVIRVAVERLSDLGRLHSLLAMVGREMGQESVYIRAMGLSECIPCAPVLSVEHSIPVEAVSHV